MPTVDSWSGLRALRSMPTVFTKSIRWRLLLWLAFLLVCLLGGFGVTAHQLQRITQFIRIDEALERRVTALQRDVRTGPPGLGELPDEHLPHDRDGDRRSSGPPPPRRVPRREMPASWPWMREIRLSEGTLGLFDENDPAGYYYVVWSRAAERLKISANAPRDVPRPGQARGGGETNTRSRGLLREAYYVTELGDCVLAGISIESSVAANRRFDWSLAAAGLAVLTLGLGGAWFLATRALRPVGQISATASRISAGHLSDRINISDTESELGRLAEVLNSTFARLEAAFAEQKHFTADASHELRTPLTVIITEAQAALARDRDPAEYREALAGCLEAAQQMRRLTDSLLELARFDAGQEDLQRAPIDLGELARNCADMVEPLAVRRGIRIHRELATAPLPADADRLGQVIVNLLQNAVHYNREGGEVRIFTSAQGGRAILRVSDTGQGIPADDLPHVFERFYRADKSRSRANGRTGLGLAICKSIVDSHGGEISVESQPGTGATFTVRLPGG